MLLALRVGGFRPGFPLLWDPNEGAGVITGNVMKCNVVRYNTYNL
jgi:hypothetical protein